MSSRLGTPFPGRQASLLAMLQDRLPIIGPEIYSRLHFSMRVQMLKGLEVLAASVPTLMGELSFLDILSGLIPDYVCTHTISAGKEVIRLRTELGLHLKITQQYGLNYLLILINLLDPSDWPAADKLVRAKLPLPLRQDLACLTFYVLYGPKGMRKPVMLISGLRCPKPNIRNSGAVLVKQEIAGVPWWCWQVNGLPNRKALKRVSLGYPYPSERDRLKMTTNVGALLTSALHMAWRPLAVGINEKYSSFHHKDMAKLVNGILANIPLGSLQPLVMTVLCTRLEPSPAPSPAWQFILDNKLLLQSPHQTTEALRLFSNCLRRYCVTPDNEKLSDAEVSYYSYWELAIGRANMLTNWRKEIQNRTTGTFHLHGDIKPGDPLKWRKADRAYPDRDPVFYELLKKHVEAILRATLPKRISQETYEQFLLRRSEWITSGSSSGARVEVDGKVMPVNKRGWAESIVAKDYAKLLYTATPIEEALQKA